MLILLGIVILAVVVFAFLVVILSPLAFGVLILSALAWRRRSLKLIFARQTGLAALFAQIDLCSTALLHIKSFALVRVPLRKLRFADLGNILVAVAMAEPVYLVTDARLLEAITAAKIVRGRDDSTELIVIELDVVPDVRGHTTLDGLVTEVSILNEIISAPQALTLRSFLNSVSASLCDRGNFRFSPVQALLLQT